VRHVPSATCLLCRQGDENVEETAVAAVCEAISKLSLEDLLSAAGAAFTHEKQQPREERLLQSALREDFGKSLKFAKDNLISIQTDQSICMVEHMYPDLGVRAFSNQRLVDTTPTEVSAGIQQAGRQS
jgi:hypothetical protein